MSRRALVVGVSRGIGLEVARALLEDGWQVTGASRSYPHDLVGIAPERFDRLGWVRADVGSPRATVALARHLHGLDRLDALVHCAAIRPAASLADATPREWLETVNVNLGGTFRVLKAALPLLLRSADARVLLFSGGGAFGPAPGFSSYAASKGGVVSLMETLAEELKGTSVTVNCVAPGYIPTGIHEHPIPDDGAAMARAVACVRHLLSPQAHGLTGKTISAPHDAWPQITAPLVPLVNQSTMGTRSRRPVALTDAQRVHLLARGERVVV